MSGPRDNERPRRVLIVSASVGAGHTQAAGAIAAGLRSAHPETHVDPVDILTFAPWAFRAYYAGGYALAVSKFPGAYGLGFRWSDRPQGPGRARRERFRLWHERQHLRRFARHVKEAAYDLIVHTHFLGPPLLGRLIERGELSARQIVVVTDIRMHRFWHAEGVDRWFVPAEPAAERLSRWGIDPGRITVSGIPVHPKWTAPLDRERILADWHLPGERPIVLLSSGVQFTCGPVASIARGIVSAGEDVFVGVLAGRNKKLLGRLARSPEAPRDLMGFSFTDRAHELVEVSSLMVTKAGGLSTAECLAKAKPMVLLPPVPGQERGNAEYLASRGAAVIVSKAADVPACVRDLLADPDRLGEMARAAGALYRPATRTIVEAAAGAEPSTR